MELKLCGGVGVRWEAVRVSLLPLSLFLSFCPLDAGFIGFGWRRHPDAVASGGHCWELKC